ncbi:amidase family protein [Corticibacter populi]|uniref:amidase family protein n=1 Tax=Corticibacter populi TaxID=1550736 RepID=UPI003BF7B984
MRRHRQCVQPGAERGRLLRRFRRLFGEVDIIVAPTTPVSPFPWTQLYLEQINGRKTRNYYRWPGLTCVVTLVTNPAIALPCGVDYNGIRQSG